MDGIGEGTEAMTTAGARLSTDPARSLNDRSTLWQLPMLMVSLALSLCAGYLFVDAKPALAFAKKLGVVREFLRVELG